MPGVLPKDALVEVLKGGVAVDIVGDDPGPVVITAVPSGPLNKPLELARRVASIVPAVATAAFPLVLEVPLEAVVERCRTIACR